MEELTLNDLLDIFIGNIKPIILTVILFVVLSVLYTKVIITPMYSASTKIILADSNKALKEANIVLEKTNTDIVGVVVNNVKFNLGSYKYKKYEYTDSNKALNAVKRISRRK